jgi:hypothetical protein
LLLFGGGLFGTWSAEQLHRWSVTYAADDANAPALPAGIRDRDAYNQAAIMARPTWQSQAWQWGLTIFTGLVGLFVPWRPVKLLLYGTALGSGLHAGYQLLNGYIMLPLIAGTTWGQRAYAAQLQANYSLGKMQPPKQTASTTQGVPMLGAAPAVRQLPAGQLGRVPIALATGSRAPAAIGPFPYGTPTTMGAAGMPGGYVGQPNAPAPSITPAMIADFQAAQRAGWHIRAVNSQADCPAGSRFFDFGADGKWCASPPPAPPGPPVTPPPSPPAPPMRPPAPPSTTTPPAPPSPPAPPACPPPPVVPACPPCPPPTTAAPQPPVPACPLPWAAAPQPCCGTNPCTCGVCATRGLPGTVLGEPPRHPLFAMMLAPRRMAA